MDKKGEDQKITFEVPLPLDFFKIQSIFAHKMAEITGVAFEQTLLEGTTFYKRIGVDDWKHNPNNLLWTALLQKISEGDDPAVVAFKMYMGEYAKSAHNRASQNCFSYDYVEPTVYVHFHNNFANDQSPLADSNRPRRQQELVKIFKEIKERYPGAIEVNGQSWLYAYKAYRELFPPEFTANLKPVEPGLKGNGAWGQFLTHTGALNQERSEQFLEAVEKSTTKEELLATFPLPTCESSAPIGCFYSFLGV